MIEYCKIEQSNGKNTPKSIFYLAVGKYSIILINKLNDTIRVYPTNEEEDWEDMKPISQKTFMKHYISTIKNVSLESIK